MGTLIKKAARAGNAVSPHTLILGKKVSAGMDLGGQALGAYDANYQPTDIPAAPSPVTSDAPAYEARDRIRRIAKRAQGVGSTVRTSSAGAPYTGQPASLLGG